MPSQESTEANFSVQEFNNLKFVGQTLKLVKPYFKEAAIKLNQVFVKHNMCDHFEIALLHRHHDLQPTEVLIETVFNDISITTPTAINLGVPQVNQQPVNEILSHMWSVKEGRLHPVEFII